MRRNSLALDKPRLRDSGGGKTCRSTVAAMALLALMPTLCFGGAEAEGVELLELSQWKYARRYMSTNVTPNGGFAALQEMYNCLERNYEQDELADLDFLTKKMVKGTDGLARFVARRVVNNWGEMGPDDLDRYFKLIEGENPPDIDEIPGDAVIMGSFQALADKNEGARCLRRYFLRGKPGRMELLLGVKDEIEPRLEVARGKIEDRVKERICDLVRPRLIDGTAEAFNSATTCSKENTKECYLLSPAEYEETASGVFVAYLADQLQAADGSFEQNGRFGATLDPLKMALAGDWDEGLRRAYVVAVFSAMGHKFVDSDEKAHGGYYISKTVSSLQISEGTLEKIASAVCGLIPEAGAAVCAVVAEVIDAWWNFEVIPQMVVFLKENLHTYIDNEMGRLEKLLNNQPAPDGGSLCEVGQPTDQSLAWVIFEAFSADLMNAAINANLNQHLQEIRSPLLAFVVDVEQLEAQLP